MITWFHKRRTFPAVACVCLLLALNGRAARADVTGINLSGTFDNTLPLDPIPVGNWVTYTAVLAPPPGGGGSSGGCTWSYRCTLPGSPNTWIFGSSYSNWATFLEGAVGAQDVNCTQFLMTQMGQRVTNFSKSINVIGPDSEQILSGLNTNTTGTGTAGDPMTITLKFEFDANGYKIGPMVGGIVQEKIDKPQWGEHSPWTTGNANYYLMNGVLSDIKTSESENADQQQWWNAIPIGGLVDDFFQQNRIIINDCTALPVTFTFPVHHFQKIKTGLTGWKLIEL